MPGMRWRGRYLDVEVICSDAVEHRRRAETRVVDVPGLVTPDWAAIQGRQYDAWRTPRLVIDTAALDEATALARIVAAVDQTLSQPA